MPTQSPPPDTLDIINTLREMRPYEAGPRKTAINAAIEMLATESAKNPAAVADDLLTYIGTVSAFGLEGAARAMWKASRHLKWLVRHETGAPRTFPESDDDMIKDLRALAEFFDNPRVTSLLRAVAARVVTTSPPTAPPERVEIGQVYTFTATITAYDHGRGEWVFDNPALTNYGSTVSSKIVREHGTFVGKGV